MPNFQNCGKSIEDTSKLCTRINGNAPPLHLDKLGGVTPRGISDPRQNARMTPLNAKSYFGGN